MNQPHSSSRQPHAWIGRSIGDGDRYRLDSCLGQGGMGDVFLATDTRLGKLVALKLLKDSLMIANNPELIERFERECAICAALKGAHIVQVSDYGMTLKGHPFYVMEYLQGQTLGHLLSTQPRLSIEQTCNIITQTCAGLHLAHRGVDIWNRDTNISEHIKVIHRDLKPDNIFLVPSALGELVKIIDFGIAKIQSLQAEYTSATVGFMGTCHYASPEQVSGRKDIDERSDLYNLGIILYEMLTGTDPFGFNFRHQRVTSYAWLDAHLSQSPIPLRSQPSCDHLSPELEAIVMRCLAKSPVDRFASVIELSLALQSASARSQPSHALLPTQLLASTTAETQTGEEENREKLSSMQPSIAEISSPIPPGRSTRQRPWWLMGGVLLALSLGIYGVPRLVRFSTQPDAVPLTATPAATVQFLALVETLSDNTHSVWSAVLSPDGQTILSGGEDRDAAGQFYSIKIWDVNSGQVLRTLDGHTGIVRSLSLSGDGQLLASGSDDNTIKLWNVATGELIQTLEGHIAPVWSVALSPDGQTVVSGGEDSTVKIWDVASGEPRTLLEHTNTVYSVAINPTGQTIASSSADKTIKLWDAATGALIRTLGEPGGHRDTVSAVAFSPDGQQLASGGWDGFVKQWNANTGQLLHTFAGHRDRVVSVTFTDSQVIASASFDHTINRWDIQTGALLQTLSAHTDQVLSVMSHADRALVSSSRDTTIKLWR